MHPVRSLPSHHRRRPGDSVRSTAPGPFPHLLPFPPFVTVLFPPGSSLLPLFSLGVFVAPALASSPAARRRTPTLRLGPAARPAQRTLQLDPPPLMQRGTPQPAPSLARLPASPRCNSSPSFRARCSSRGACLGNLFGLSLLLRCC